MEQNLHLLLYRTFHAQRKYLRAYMKELGLGGGQPKLIAYLSDHGPCRQRDLADYFEIDPAAVCRMLDALQKGGFIIRQTDSLSRRRDLIAITEQGRQAAQAWRGRCREAEAIMLQGFTPEEIIQFSNYLARAHQNFRIWQEGHPCEI